MLKNRKKILALILGMSMMMTFPVRAAGPEEDGGSLVKEEIPETTDTVPESQPSDQTSGIVNTEIISV